MRLGLISGKPEDKVLIRGKCEMPGARRRRRSTGKTRRMFISQGSLGILR